VKEHYIVTVDRGNLRIYAEAQPSGSQGRLEVVESVDLPPDREASSDSTRDLPARAGASSDVLATELDLFLQTRPEASWDVAAAPALFNVIIGRISAETRQRLRRVISKVLVNDRAEEVRAQFAALA
jgi:hypothetical protein